MRKISGYFGKTILAAIFGLTLSAVSISAATFTVTNTNDTGAGSLRQAVMDANAAATADTIVFDSSFNTPRTITLATRIEISPAASVDTLTITGPGANLLTIRSSSEENVGIFQNGANNGSADTTSISGITFGQGTAPNPGRSILSFGNLNISNCVFTNNRAFDINQPGASIQHANSNASLNVDNSVFTGNTTFGGSSNGGAISTSGTATITNSTFTSNTSGSGGAIASFGSLSVTGCTFTNNTAGFGGGGILSESGVTPVSATITNSTFTGNLSNGGGGGGGIRHSGGTMNISGLTFTNNTSVRGGGGITTFNATTNITNSTFTGNKATGYPAASGNGMGGAVSNEGNSAQTTITNSLISGNEAINSAGGIYHVGMSMNVTNTTISYNIGNYDGFTEPFTFPDDGGGLLLGNGTANLTNCTIYRNSVLGGRAGGGIVGAANLKDTIVANNTAANGPDLSGGFGGQGYNLVTNTSGGTISGTGNIIGVDPRLGPLSFNGGATRTHALLAGSPAIDAGDPTTFPATDQRGISRPQDGDGTGGARSDIGAYERRLNDVLSNNRVDFDGDGKTDLSIFRPSVGEWWYLRSSNNSNGALQFGLNSDRLVPADYTGDGRADIAFFRPSNGFWFILRSEDFSFLSFPFGANGDVPVTGDFDGDGKADPTIYRPTTNEWFILKSSGGTTITTFGTTGDLPVVADYDGDGKTDLAIYRPSAGEWWIQQSSNNSVYAFQFGNSTDKPVQGDYTGDGKADAAFFRPSTGFWFILRSENSSFYSVPFGANGDQPSPGDYDGDGKFDTAVFRPSNATWFINATTAGVLIGGFGAAGDISVPNSFVP